MPLAVRLAILLKTLATFVAAAGVGPVLAGFLCKIGLSCRVPRRRPLGFVPWVSVTLRIPEVSFSYPAIGRAAIVPPAPAATGRHPPTVLA